MSKSKTAAFVAGVVGFAVLSVFAAPVANAQTTADLQAQISALLAQIAQLQAMAGGSTMTGGSAPVAPLTVGSTGAEVSKLQSWLISKGYGIAAGATGTFGPQTQAALGAFQAANGISPAAGYYGPVTAAKVAAMMGPATPGTQPTPGCPSGAMFNSVTGAPCSQTPGPVMNGTDGSVTISFNPFAPTAQTLKKGETKDVVAIKLQATSGDVNVTRFDVNFSARPWLYFTKLVLKDQNGNVLATKMINGASDATEVNVGSNYLVRFDGVNAVVKPGMDTIFVVAATVSNDSDKITGNPVIYVGVPSGSIRTINGRGYTDSVGLSGGQGSGVTNGTGNAVTISSDGSVADLATRISTASPLQRIVTTLQSGQTPDVVLGVFGVKTINRGATLNAMTFNINNSGDTSGAVGTSSLVSNVRLCDGSMCYGASSLAAGGGATFTNMTINLAEDTWKDLTLRADIVSGIGGANGAISASSTLVKASVVGVDTNYNAVNLTNAANITSNDTTFLLSGITVTNPVATLGSAVVQNNNTVGYNGTFSFTVSNGGNNPVYVAKAPGAMLATSSAESTGGSTASSTVTSVIVSPDQISGDTTLAYTIPSGQSRTFTFSARVSPVAGGGAQAAKLKITAVYFGTDPASHVTLRANNITFGLSSLNLTANF